MARYILLEIDDNEVAGDLVLSLQTQEDAKTNLFFYKFAEGNQGEYKVGQVKAKVVGLFGKPTTFCECKPVGELIKGAKLGWFVCNKCKRALRTRQYPRNLIEPEPPGPTVWERIYHNMYSLGSVEGLDHNPAADWRPPSGKSSYVGKRS